MSESINFEKGKDRVPVNKAISAAAEASERAKEAQQIPGTDSFSPGIHRPVGREAIEAESVLGHDNLGAESELTIELRHENEQDRNGASPEPLN